MTEVTAINRSAHLALLASNEVIGITNFIDSSGDDCGHVDAVTCVCGPDALGNWYVVDLSKFDGQVLQ